MNRLVEWTARALGLGKAVETLYAAREAFGVVAQHAAQWDEVFDHPAYGAQEISRPAASLSTSRG